MTTKILVIDDDKFIHKVIKRALEPFDFDVRYAFDGKSGIDATLIDRPDIILLDVEMPGANGYEVCEHLKNVKAVKDIAIVFLSSQSSLRERLQGYEVGGDDYLTKPFEKEHLVARLKVLGKYQKERKEMQEQYQLAQKTAITAMTGTSEISIALQFMERSITYTSIEETMQGLLETTDQFQMECCVCIDNGLENYDWYSSDGAVSPLEKELVEMSDKNLRFMDFGCRTVAHYHPVSILVKNMPLDDMNRYGRLKDLLPVLLSIVNTKLNALKTFVALVDQSKDLRHSFIGIRKNLFTLASTLVKNRERSNLLTTDAINNLSMKFMGMGLETDQEAFIIDLIESSFTDTLNAIDIGEQLRHSFSFILDNLNETMSKHDSLLEEFIQSQAEKVSVAPEEIDDDIELF